MVGYLPNPTTDETLTEEAKENLKIQSLSDYKIPSSPNDSFDLGLPEFDDLSSFFTDSVLGFDSHNGWFIEGDQKMSDLGENLLDFGLDKGELGTAINGDGFCEVEDVFNEKVGFLGGLEQEKGEFGVVAGSTEMGSDGICDKVVVDDVLDRDRKSGDLGGLIEEKLGKVSLDGAVNVSESSEKSENVAVGGEVRGVDGLGTVKILSLGGDNVGSGSMDGLDKSNVVGVNESGTKSSETVSDEDESDSDAESEGESSSSSSSTSSSSSSSSDDEDEDDDEDKETKGEDSKAISGKKKVKNEDETENGEIDMEEGEIILSDADEMVAWSDNEDAEDGGATGPITSKNELKVLPPVPTVTATLQPDHQTLPVGVILSILGTQVIVEGIEKHNPLNEGSILWITDSRSPLGIIDEIFGPVKNPYYIVRYNSESEVPTGIQQGTLISFVQEFADHVLNDKSLYQKGYDASGENDEELADELEFSDDEKEAEFKRMLKMKKRGTNESKPGSKRNEKRQFKNQTGNWKGNKGFAPKSPLGGDNLPANQGADPHVTASLNQGNSSSSSGFGQGLSSDQAMVPPFPMRPPAPGFCAPNGMWPNGFPPQLPQNIGLHGGLPQTPMQWMQQSHPHQLYQPPPNMSQQPISSIPGFPGNFNPLNGPLNFGGGAPFVAPWGGACMDQNLFNQLQFGMGLQSQQAPPRPLHVGGEQAGQSHGPQINHTFEASAADSGNTQNFNQGRGGGGGGRRGQHRGRGRGRGGGRGRNYGQRG